MSRHQPQRRPQTAGARPRSTGVPRFGGIGVADVRLEARRAYMSRRDIMGPLEALTRTLAERMPDEPLVFMAKFLEAESRRQAGETEAHDAPRGGDGLGPEAERELRTKLEAAEARAKAAEARAAKAEAALAEEERAAADVVSFEEWSRTAGAAKMVTFADWQAVQAASSAAAQAAAARAPETERMLRGLGDDVVALFGSIDVFFDKVDYDVNGMTSIRAVVAHLLQGLEDKDNRAANAAAVFALIAELYLCDPAATGAVGRAALKQALRRVAPVISSPLDPADEAARLEAFGRRREGGEQWLLRPFAPLTRDRRDIDTDDSAEDSGLVWDAASGVVYFWLGDAGGKSGVGTAAPAWPMPMGTAEAATGCDVSMRDTALDAGIGGATAHWFEGGAGGSLPRRRLVESLNARLGGRLMDGHVNMLLAALDVVGFEKGHVKK